MQDCWQANPCGSRTQKYDASKLLKDRWNPRLQSFSPGRHLESPLQCFSWIKTLMSPKSLALPFKSLKTVMLWRIPTLRPFVGSVADLDPDQGNTTMLPSTSEGSWEVPQALNSDASVPATPIHISEDGHEPALLSRLFQAHLEGTRTDPCLHHNLDHGVRDPSCAYCRRAPGPQKKASHQGQPTATGVHFSRLGTTSTSRECRSSRRQTLTALSAPKAEVAALSEALTHSVVIHDACRDVGLSVGCTPELNRQPSYLDSALE